MSTQVQEYEVLLREALTQARAAAPQVVDDLNSCASQAAEAIAKVTDRAVALDLIPLVIADGVPPAFQLLLRRTGHDAPPSDLGVYQVSDAGYPVQRWNSLGSRESGPDEADDRYENKSALDGRFRWMVSNRSSRLVVLVAFIMQQTRKGNDTAEAS